MTHFLLALLHTVPGKLILIGTVIMDILAVSEPSNHTVVILAISGNLTAIIGVIFTGWIQIKSARISAANSAMLRPLVDLPEKVTKLTEGIDGVAHELKAAKEEGAVARIDAADARGQLKEREAETARQGAAALAQQTSTIVENTKENPANVKL